MALKNEERYQVRILIQERFKCQKMKVLLAHFLREAHLSQLG